MSEEQTPKNKKPELKVPITAAIGIIVLGLAIWELYYFYSIKLNPLKLKEKPIERNNFISQSENSKVCFGVHCFFVELAETLEEKEMGLMFREKLDLNKGMLFIFEEEKEYSFWMKNTLFPLDIIWINKDREVVFIKNNVLPCGKGDCPSIIPDTKAKYVLELNGGTANKINLKTGDKFDFRID